MAAPAPGRTPFGSDAQRRRGAQNAILLGLTDLFVGASAVALIMIMMSRQVVQPVYVPQSEVVIRCAPDGDGLELSGRSGERVWSLALDRLADLPQRLDRSRLDVRVTVATPPADLSCFWRVKAFIDRYNSGLGNRQQTPGPLVILDWGPDPEGAVPTAGPGP